MPNSNKTCRSLRILFIPVFATLLALLLSGCSDRKDITIGYIGPQSGANGALLAAEKISANGGVNGKAVKIISINSEKKDFQASQALESLVEGDAGVVIDATGQLSQSGQKPGKTSIVITGGKAGNLAIENPLVSAAAQTANQIWQDKAFSVSVIVDQADRSYNGLWLQAFREGYEKNRGVILKIIDFDSSRSDWETNLATVVKKALIKETRGLVVVADAKVASMVCRQARKMRKKLPLALAETALTDDLLELQEKNLDGAMVVKIFTSEGDRENYIRFVKEYRGNLGSIPNFSAASAYDAVGLIASAYTKKKKLPEGFAALAEYRGVLGTAAYEDGTFKWKTQLGRIAKGKVTTIKETAKKNS